ncbi:hypothetical protein PROFUN_16669 [Planoprotostelium fungivorum]|uniref:Uncharacterized protein n=1 Tax=Planoprotostelium fungivorum TaxID=1890364 RepID=A0A2P6MPW6_9EUKA|nr:hypothetical protein PROFUN_16669 [Planoprotostelium fungivorum]
MPLKEDKASRASKRRWSCCLSSLIGCTTEASRGLEHSIAAAFFIRLRSCVLTRAALLFLLLDYCVCSELSALRDIYLSANAEMDGPIRLGLFFLWRYLHEWLSHRDSVEWVERKDSPVLLQAFHLLSPSLNELTERNIIGGIGEYDFTGPSRTHPASPHRSVSHVTQPIFNLRLLNTLDLSPIQLLQREGEKSNQWNSTEICVVDRFESDSFLDTLSTLGNMTRSRLTIDSIRSGSVVANVVVAPSSGNEGSVEDTMEILKAIPMAVYNASGVDLLEPVGVATVRGDVLQNRNNESLAVGPVVGGVIGGFLLLLIVTIVIFVLYQRWLKRKVNGMQLSLIDLSQLNTSVVKRSLICFDDLHDKKMIGSGAFGVVYRAKSTEEVTESERGEDERRGSIGSGYADMIVF